MSYTICSRFKGEHIVYAGYTICTSREHIVYGAFCGSTVLFSCVFVTFPYGVPGQVWYSIVSITDRYPFPYLHSYHHSLITNKALYFMRIVCGRRFTRKTKP